MLIVISLAEVANKCLNVRERVEVVDGIKDGPSLPLLSCELSVSMKENADRKKKKNFFRVKKIEDYQNHISNFVHNLTVNMFLVKI